MVTQARRTGDETRRLAFPKKVIAILVSCFSCAFNSCSVAANPTAGPHSHSSSSHALSLQKARRPVKARIEGFNDRS